ncbi:MAG: NUDIX domain-containing protein [Candidatus Dojkabacteria bacterium]|nr:NUDIX domain-containing protein [Candidatus Dojkabacteria bacterium]MDQ7020343.1 NUDIX domain-containing protein [Candidatus Dojkabacteria bacterium]
MNTNNLHYIQMLIVKDLLFREGASFTDINTKEIDSEHFAYHIKKLIELNLVKKTEDKRYYLTPEGKKFGRTIDVFKNEVEKQPLVAVVGFCIKDNKVLMLKRLKSPFFGYYGVITGTVKYGESFEESLIRETKEEADIIPTKFRQKCIVHDRVYTKQKEILEDKLFILFEINEFNGTPKKTIEGEPIWIEKQQLGQLENKFYDIEDLLKWTISPPEGNYIEKDYFVDRSTF